MPERNIAFNSPATCYGSISKLALGHDQKPFRILVVVGLDDKAGGGEHG